MVSEDLRNLAMTVRWYARQGLTQNVAQSLSQRLDALADQARALEGGHVPATAAPAMLDTNIVMLADRRRPGRDGAA